MTKVPLECDISQDVALDAKLSYAAGGLFSGRLTGFTEFGAPLITNGATPPRHARSIVPLDISMLGAEVLCGTDASGPLVAIVLGVFLPERPIRRNLSLSGLESVEITCGAAKIQMQADGKIVIDGGYVITRAERTNRIEGGVVQIN